ncbi:MAG: PaaI family thioesterase [Terriglobales bacterium]
MIERLEPQPDNPCFGCGAANPRGLRLAFALDREQRRVTGRFVLGPDFQGSDCILHGGVTALIFDEAMGKLNRLNGGRAVTAELQVEYLRPISTADEIVVEAAEVSRAGRSLHQRAEIRNPAGEVLARARARFVTLR